MNQSGIIRKIDDLGRIVLPKELRKHLNINSGDDFQILLDNERIILQKYSYLNNYESDIVKIINCFKELNKYDINLIINNKIINKNNSVLKDRYINIIKERKQYIDDSISNKEIAVGINIDGKLVLTPIVMNSDLLGSIIIVSKDSIENIIGISKIIINIIKNYFN